MFVGVDQILKNKPELSCGGLMINYILPEKRRNNLFKTACVTSLITVFSLFNFPSYAGSVSYTYDELGRVISVSYPNGTTVSYQYDAAGNRTVVTTGGGGGSNNAPTCVATAMTISSPSPTAVNYPVSAANILSKCSDIDGDTLTVTSPVTPYVVNLPQGTTRQFQYTVSDGRGGTATQTFTIRRL